MNPSKPFIIWTLRRTGGTNLTQRLVERSGLPATQHEPFNVARVYGEITQAWLDTRGEMALERAMLDVVARQGIIKHCVEIVPWEVTRALATAAVNAGYRHLFLYRKQPRDRLLSLYFAQKTGIWGPGMKKDEIVEEALDKPIPVRSMAQHEKLCANRLMQTWRFLRIQGARPMALSYEELYRAVPEAAEKKLQPVLEMLGLQRSPQEDHAFVWDVLGKGDQGTRDKYADIPGVAKLDEALAGLTAFEPGTRLGPFAIERAEMPTWVVRAQIDTLPNAIPEDGKFAIGGVLVVGQDAPEGLVLKLNGPAGAIQISWNIESQKMKMLYPVAGNSGQARFISAEIPYARSEEFTLQISDNQGKMYALFGIFA